MKPNLLKRKLSQGGVALGINMQDAFFQGIEILALLGFDYINIDCLHAPLSIESAARMVQTAEMRGITAMVRVPQNVPEVILRYLDVGAGAIMVADMNNAQIARQAVRAVKYPPEGERGLAPVRVNDFGLGQPLGDYVRFANQETMVTGVIESKEGVDGIEEILSIPGLDAVTIGTTDLSISLGVPGQLTHPLLQEAIQKILAAGQKTGKAIGIPLRRGESPKQAIEKGFRLMVTHMTTLVAGAAQKLMEEFKS
jgi:4-hydroxy-2-oxoheptanedioate aldolase